MPYQWSDPEIFMIHKGVVVYRTYDGGPGNENTCEYWYALEACKADEGSDDQFDVRELPKTPVGWLEYYSDLYPDEGHKQRIAHAIDNGHFKIWDMDEPPPYWWLTEEQVNTIHKAAYDLLYAEVEDLILNDPHHVCDRYAKMRMDKMGIHDLVDIAEDAVTLGFDPEQQPTGD